MSDKAEKELKQILDATLGTATVLQGTQVIKARGNVSKLAGTIPGLIGIGVSGVAAQISADLIIMPRKRKKKRRR